MPFTSKFAPLEPARAALDQTPGALLLEFGTPWCSWCQGAQPLLAEALQAYPALTHLKIEDGPGRPLGRSFRVKLWPTLICLQDGAEVARLVRPASAGDITAVLARLTSSG